MPRSPPRMNPSREEARAMEESQLASDLLCQQKYKEALEHYQKSFDLYILQRTTLRICNAAGCLRNMGAIHRAQRSFSNAVSCWKQAEELYRECRSLLPRTSATTNNHQSEETISLDALLIETIQSRATTSHKYLNDGITTLQCHQDILKILLDTQQQWKEPKKYSVLVEDVLFLPLTRDKYTLFLMNAVDNIASIYKADMEIDTESYQNALQILENIHLTFPNNKLTLSLVRGMRFHADIVLLDESLQLSLAVQLIQKALQIEIEYDVENAPTQETMDTLDSAGFACENAEQLDLALECFERALLTRSQFLGEKHISVAKSLINVARVMEKQGNQEGSLDLYLAAKQIYAEQLVSQNFDGGDTTAILEIIPTLMDQGRYEEAALYLNKVLEAEESCKDVKSQLDKAQTYFDLGKAYMAMRDYVSATICFVEAAKQDGDVTEEDIFTMLQRVEFLQRRQEMDDISDESGNVFDTTDDAIVLPFDVKTVKHDEKEEIVDTSGSLDMMETPITNYKDIAPKKNGKSFRDLTPVTANTLESAHSDTSELSKDKGYTGASEGEEDDGSDYEDSIIETMPPVVQADTSDILSGVEESVDLMPLKTKSPDALQKDKLDESFDGQSDVSHHLRGLSVDISYTDEERPTAADVSVNKTMDSETRRRLGLRFSMGSPRSKTQRLGSKFDSTKQIGGKLSSKFRRRRRDGFESLPEEKETTEFDDDALLNYEEQYHTSFDGPFDGPMQFISVHQRSKSFDDGVSQVTLMLDDPKYNRNRGNEWWFGVSAEGFGRWFPTSYVSKAVEAAEGFLSAKAIHAKVKPAPLAGSSEEGTLQGEKLPEEGQEMALQTPSERTQSLPADSDKETAIVPAKLCSIPTGSRHDETILSASSPRRDEQTNEEVKRHADLVKKLQAELGRSHPDLAPSYLQLALLQRKQRNIDAALLSTNEALRIQKANNMAKDCAETLHYLGELYMYQQDYNSALNFFTDALRIEEEEYGYYCERMAKTLNCIGTVHSLQDEFGVAMECHQEALQILKECHGEGVKDPLVSQTLCLIGSVYYRERNCLSTIKSNTGDYSTFIEAGMLEIIGRAHEDRGSYKMAIAFFEEKLQFLESNGDQGEEMAMTLNSLGMLSSRAGLYLEAIDFYDRALNIQLDIGCDAVYLGTARVLTGTVQYQLGNWQKGLELLQEALDVLRKELGEHETVAATLYHIGVVLALQCEYDDSMTALDDALSIQNKILGKKHPATLRTRREIGNLFAVYEAELDTAFAQYNAILKIQHKIHGEKHPNIAETFHSIGCAYSRKGDFDAALKWFEDCYYMRLEFLGVDHPQQANTLYEIAKIYLLRGRHKKALEIIDTVLIIRRDSLNDRHIDVARALSLKGSCLTMRGDFASANKHFQQALVLAEESVGESHPYIAEICVQYGLKHLRMCHFDEARATAERAVEIYRHSKFDDDHPGIKEALDLLERVEREEMLYV